MYCNYQGTWKSGDAKNSLGIFNIQSQWIVYIVKVSWLFTLLNSADILHSKSQLITESYLNMEGIDFFVKILVVVKILVYIVKVSWLFTLLNSADILHSKSQLITESYLNMEGIDYCQNFGFCQDFGLRKGRKEENLNL